MARIGKLVNAKMVGVYLPELVDFRQKELAKLLGVGQSELMGALIWHGTQGGLSPELVTTVAEYQAWNKRKIAEVVEARKSPAVRELEQAIQDIKGEREKLQ